MDDRRSKQVGSDREPTMAERLLSPERERWADSALVLSHLAIAPNARIADIGCGPGYFTVRLASAADRGLVYALDVDPEMLALCRQQASAAGAKNVLIRRCQEYEFDLAEGTFDLAFLSCVIHHADDQVRFLAAAARLLKPCGRCAMLEWVERESDFGPPPEHRIGPDRLIEIAFAAGFKSHKYHELSEHQYLVVAAPGV